MEATETNIDSTERLDVAKPKKYQVVVFNDDQTPMEFVIVRELPESTTLKLQSRKLLNALL